MHRESENRAEGIRRLLGKIMILEIILIALLVAVSVLAPSILASLGESPLLPVLAALLVMVPIVWLILTAMSGSAGAPEEEEETDGEKESFPAYTGDFPDYSFLRVQRLSGPDAITSRDRVILLTREGTYEISAESRAPGACVSLYFKGGVLSVRGQKDIPLESGRPLILYSDSSAGTRIPQYALTYIRGKEAPHA